MYDFDTVYFYYREAAAGPRRRAIEGHSMADIDDLPDELPAITREDFESAIKRTRPSVSADALKEYDTWNQKFGSC